MTTFIIVDSLGFKINFTQMYTDLKILIYTKNLTQNLWDEGFSQLLE